MPWLADPSQEPASSWLNSPAVMFIGSVISIIQAVLAVGKWAKEMADNEDARRRLTITFATAAIVANAVITPLTWTSVVAADRGDSRLVADLYPLMACLMVLAGVTYLLFVDLKEKKWPSILASSLIALGLALPVIAYCVADSRSWSAAVAGIIPSAAMLTAIPAVLVYVKTNQRDHKGSSTPAAS